MGFVFLDLETCGLDPNNDPILEVGIVVTFDNLVVTAQYQGVIAAPFFLRDAANPIVQTMHDNNGLWEDCRVSAKSPVTIEQEAVRFVKEHTALGKTPMCGNTIGFDRSFLKAQMPALHDCFSHRNLDVSVLRELAERWYPAVFANRPQTPTHRAIPDCLGSIAQLVYYKQHMFAAT